MGSVGSYNNTLTQLEKVNGGIFQDSLKTPLHYDQTMLMEVNFGAWQTDDNYVGEQEININDIYTAQPYVREGRLRQLGKAVDTSSVAVLDVDGKYYVADGNHRIVANKLAGKNKVKVRVYRRK